jgi:arabinofuranan 3-O-arabinosyltransferase
VTAPLTASTAPADGAVAAPEARRRPGWSGRRSIGVLALLSFGPVWWSSPGWVGADTKQYLYLDPGELLSRAGYLWDEHVAFGTVTHQNIGYLWPMGPFFWLFDALGVPDWAAQRLWLGLLFFAAGAGARWLGRLLGLDEAPALVTGIVYACNPLTLVYLARISAILMPWAALPWMIGLVHLALRRGRWREPAVFALVVTTIGSVNATSLIYAGLGPVLWVLWSVLVLRESTWRRAIATCLRIAVLVIPTQIWWIAGLWAQGGYGLNVLEYTETVETVSTPSTSTEVLRGLGNWFFYGRDQIGPWIEASVDYTERVSLIALSFALPTLALVAAGATRWRHRGFALVLVVTGLVIAVGTHPHDDPSPLGWLFKEFAARSTFGLALRSSPRAVPLLALGLALLLGSGLVALGRALAAAPWGWARASGWRVGATALVGVMAAVNLWPMWSGSLVAGNLRRKEHIPDYWYDAAGWLDAQGDATRVLELPGSDFAAYRWGNAVDPVTPGIMDRPWAARELIPFGSAASADLLMALDRRLQEGVLDPAAIAPIARMFSVGDVVLRSDLEYERYKTPRPRPTWAMFEATPGLDEPIGFGEPVPNRAAPEVPLLDEIELGTPAGAGDPPPVAAFPVTDAVPIVRAEPVAGTTVVAGDGEGMVESAAAGLVDGHGSVLYAASLATDPDLAASLDPDALLVLTDTNRRAGVRWGTVRENRGSTEQAGEEPLRVDEGDTPLDVFPGATDDSRTVAEHRGVGGVRASRYGNTVSLTPEDRAVLALDGDLTTAWTVGGLGSGLDEWLRVELAGPTTADRVVLTQPQGPANRWLTRVTVRLESADGSVESLGVDLGDESRSATGQVVTFPSRDLVAVEVHIDDTNIGDLAEYVGFSQVGLAELAIGEPGAVVADEVLRLPVDLLELPGADALTHPLAVVLGRLRANPAEPVRRDPERAMARTFSLPAGRSFAVEGEVRVSDAAPDDVIDDVLGYPGPGDGGVRATSSDRLPGSPATRASAAVDEDLSTWWSAGFGEQVGRWVEIEVGGPTQVAHLDLTVVADGRHSVPTRLTLQADDGVPVDVVVPPVADQAAEGATTTVRVDLPAPITATRLRVTVAEVRVVTTIEYFSRTDLAMPVAIAELGASGFTAGTPAGFDAACRTDLLTVDGEPVPVRVEGDLDAAGRREGVALVGCADVDLAAGDHDVRTAEGRETGLDLDRVVLASAAGGGAAPVADLVAARDAERATATVPEVRVVDDGPVSATVEITGATEPFWLVLGQSRNDGWRAEVEGGGSLGTSVLVDGYANGWLVTPDADGTMTVQLDWTPERVVRGALAVSGLGVLACLALIVVPGRRGRGPAAAGDADVDSDTGWGETGEDVPARPSPRTGEPERPEPVGPLRWGGPAPRPAVVAGLGVAAAAVGALVLGPLPGVAFGVAVALAARVRAGRVLVGVGPWLVVGLVAGYVCAKQLFKDYRSQFSWPEQFEAAHRWTYVAVLLAVAEVAVAAAWARGRECEPVRTSTTARDDGPAAGDDGVDPERPPR